MKKISFVLILLIALGFIMYYYSEKKNISLLQETSNKVQTFAKKTFNRLSEYNPENKDNFISEVKIDNPVNIIGEWVLVNYFDIETQFNPIDTSVFSITFDTEGKISGTTDCNSFSGSYKKDASNIIFNQFFTTRMACPDSQEFTYHNLLDNMNHVEIQDNSLVLNNNENNNTLTFVSK